jgi:hypothetical protein
MVGMVSLGFSHERYWSRKKSGGLTVLTGFEGTIAGAKVLKAFEGRGDTGSITLQISNARIPMCNQISHVCPASDWRACQLGHSSDQITWARRGRSCRLGFRGALKYRMPIRVFEVQCMALGDFSESSHMLRIFFETFFQCEKSL